MRRTQAQLVMPGIDMASPVIALADLRCTVCGRPCDGEGAVFAFGRDTDRGAVELNFCSVDHARERGWPWLGRGA